MLEHRKIRKPRLSIHLQCIALILVLIKIVRSSQPGENLLYNENLESDNNNLPFSEGRNNYSEIANNLVNTFIKLNMDMKNRKELDEQMAFRLGQESAPDGQTKNTHAFTPAHASKAPFNLKTREEIEDERIIAKSLASLSTHPFKAIEKCDVCCACRNSALVGSVGSGRKSACSKRVLVEIQEILKIVFKDHVSAVGTGESSLLNQLFSRALPESCSFTNNIVRRIILIPDSHIVLKTYLIILLDSILMDLCNSYHCPLCRSLYSEPGFMMYRVVRAANVFTKSRDVRGLFGMERLEHSLSSIEEARRLLVSLSGMFDLIKINSEMRGIYTNVITRDITRGPSKMETVSELLTYMLGLTIVLNSSDSIYYFLVNLDSANLTGSNLIPIPNVYNMSTHIYDTLGAIGINDKNIANIIRQYNSAAGSNAHIMQDGIIKTLQSAGLFMQSPANVKVKLAQPLSLFSTPNPMSFAGAHTNYMPNQMLNLPNVAINNPQVNYISSMQHNVPLPAFSEVYTYHPTLKKGLYNSQKDEKVKTLAQKIDSAINSSGASAAAAQQKGAKSVNFPDKNFSRFVPNAQNYSGQAPVQVPTAAPRQIKVPVRIEAQIPAQMTIPASPQQMPVHQAQMSHSVPVNYRVLSVPAGSAPYLGPSLQKSNVVTPGVTYASVLHNTSPTARAPMATYGHH
ncbi:hypothetical protein NEMIN01_1487 [Nematocida minor]|uniref:uncharacterized protein n=1 Tax=Nematocida minor TaxID=1912983 RepID=UPI002220F6B7|nr:uncharacterized protein NEMIN01_1487 [Nematocida minor]KAI5191328.1 hypothetical protein NEMIN01_1487 [Nematocida minor]